MADFDSSLPIRTENDGDAVVKLGDGTTPSQQLAIDACGNASVEVQNGAGACAVNIQDGGNSITVDDGCTTLSVDDGGATLSIDDACGSITVDDGGLTISVDDGCATLSIDDGCSTISIDDACGSITVDATDLDIRQLTHVGACADSIQIGDGTETLGINADGSINVKFSADPAGCEIVDFQTSACIAKNASVNHDYTVTACTTFFGEELWVSGSGKLKVEASLQSACCACVYNTVFVGFNSTATPNIRIPLERMVKQTSGLAVRLTITNKDGTQDVYSTLTGVES
jgi:hypothetical protein